MKTLLAYFCLSITIVLNAQAKPTVSVGSKTFTEGYIVAEIVAQVIEGAGELDVNRKFGLGATGIIYEALKGGAIDVYPEYSGTVSEAILKNPALVNLSEIKAALKPLNIHMSESLGFNNTYALATRENFAKEKNLSTISDLAKIKTTKAGFSSEFMSRQDGFAGLAKKYGLEFSLLRSMEHSLTYQALEKKEIDFTDVYSTDAKIQKLNLKVLDDDQGYFPKYFAVILARDNFVKAYPATWLALKRLEHSISSAEMIQLNSMVDLDHKTFSEAAATFVKKNIGEKWTPPAAIKKTKIENQLSEILKRTKEHLFLVFVSLAAAVLIGVPLGIFSVRYRRMGQFILLLSGLFQTIPSLALLSFLIPLFGIGQLPALVALFLYGLLPIVVGTYLGLTTLDPRLRESSRALGFTRLQRLRLVELPLASPSILTGIKTSMIIGIGTATLAALIGAGGYGVPIITGLAINDTSTILLGAVPAAVMALIAQKLFDMVEWVIIPAGLKNNHRSS
jgi:osmoprotectant transport system permease protein